MAQQLRQLADREITWVGDVDRPSAAAVNQPDHCLDQFIPVAGRARMSAIAEKSQRHATKSLNDEDANHLAIVRQHARPIGVEGVHHTDLHNKHALEFERQV